MTEKPEAQGQRKARILSGVDEQILLQSVFKDANGQPRFALPIPRGSWKDIAIKFLIERESRFGGYEYPTRAFFDAHLEPGDLFIDVGAHWGVMALSAATRHPGAIKVLAIEAHPGNVTQLITAIAHNKLRDSIDVIAAAAGDAPGTAPLVPNSTMGHSLHDLGLKGLPQSGIPISVPIATIDSLLDERPALQGRRSFLKIDVEGFEPQVVAGARRLLDSGTVAALIWEKGRAFDEEPAKSAMEAMIADLDRRGFQHFVLPSHDLGGPLLPLVPAPGSCNVFSLSPGFEPWPHYCRPAGTLPPMAGTNRGTSDPAERARLTEALMAVKGSDGTRWSDPAELAAGAEDRAKLAARHLRPGERVLDLGAGLMRLRGQLPDGATYRPVDLMPLSADTLITDLNRQPFPAVPCDMVTALDVLEYLYDVPALLASAARQATRLIASYHCRTTEDVATRRSEGWFNDYSADEFTALLQTAGWTVEAEETGAGTRLFVCARHT